MKRISLGVACLSVAFLGAGCFDPLPQPARKVQSPALTQPLRPPTDDGVTNLRVDALLGIQFPTEGPGLFRESSVPKQEGILFYGPSYRLATNDAEGEHLIGRVQILNVTNPYRSPRAVLDESLHILLGCGGTETKVGPACDFGGLATATINGLEMRSYPVTYYPRRQNQDTFSTSTVWLVPVPTNEDAWFYIYPADLESADAARIVDDWVRSLVKI
jgi:hypothetical protein